MDWLLGEAERIWNNCDQYIYIHVYVRGGGVSRLLLRRGSCDAVAAEVVVGGVVGSLRVVV